MIENKQDNARFSKNKGFLQSYHNNVVSSGKQGLQASMRGGETVTMKIVGLEYNGKEYLLPSYDPETKTIMSPQQIVEKFKPLMDSGEIEGYKNPSEAELDRKIMYPTIVGDMPSMNKNIKELSQSLMANRK
tara:strand:+ start:563 stop:958 length:396 start_codon:yes stop_codon:yes gene_type:complete